MRKFGDDVRRGRRDQEQVCPIGELDVTRPPIFFLVVEACCHGVFRKRLQCKRGNKLSRVTSHHDKNFMALFDEQTGELRGFIGGN